MKDIIELLQNERTKTVDALKQGEQDKLSHLQQLDKALGWLKVVEDNELATVGSYKIHRLPVSKLWLLLLSFNGRQRKWRSERLDGVQTR